MLFCAAAEYRRLGKVITNAKKESYRSNTQNNHADRGHNLRRDILTLGRNLGLDSTDA